MDYGVERVRFVGTGIVEQLAHVQPTRAQARTHARTRKLTSRR
jgi:hypothetical protein